MGRLMEETGLTSDQSEYISTIRSCGENLLSVIDDIMDYTKLESSGLSFSFFLFILFIFGLFLCFDVC